MFTINPIRKLAVPLAAAALAAAAAMPAQARETASSIEVRYDDLDLAGTDGQKMLKKRLEKAARTVCGINSPRTGSRLATPYARACYREARASSQRQFAQIMADNQRGG